TALLLLTLQLSRVSAQELSPRAVVQKNYNMTKVSGTWDSVSTASDDMKRIEENRDLRLFIQNIESLVHEECEHVAVVCKRTGKEGEYSIYYEGDNAVLLSETDYRLYATFYLRNIRNGTETTVLALYGRVPDLRPSFLDRFESVCRKHGLGLLSRFLPRSHPQRPVAHKATRTGSGHWDWNTGLLGGPRLPSLSCPLSRARVPVQVAPSFPGPGPQRRLIWGARALRHLG
uniref:Lipocalin/cytosolic fatty-acid binding domain-containing protein n=1 Tax=Suricata suricatta TaxID=37032 RepID=A0A673UIT6_SURSU